MGFAPMAHASTPNVSTISVTNCTNYSGAGTLGNALSSYHSGDTIQFNCSGGVTNTYTISVPSTIVITNTLTMNGNGYQVSLNGNKFNRNI